MPASDRFYVGYLPLPEPHKRFLRAIIPLITLGIIALAAGIAASQRNPGPAVWNTTSEQTWTGTLLTKPYPILVDDNEHAHLIVEIGKLGPREQLHDPTLSFRTVTLTGYPLERSGRSMIELVAGDRAIQINPDEHATPLPDSALPRRSEPVTLTGEILDAKCFLGAMKPGDGKAHKACATLCIAGGIPPAFYTNNADSNPAFYLLVTTDITSARDLVLPYVGEPVTIQGQSANFNQTDLRMLIIDEGSITRGH